MRIINKSHDTGGEIVTTYIAQPPIDPAERQPCWYVDYIAEEAAWKVGIKSQEQNEEYTFVVDPEDQEKRSVGFALRLMNIFRESGTEGVESWIRDGCP